MRKINKQNEPHEWMIYRLTPGVDYQATPELRESLLREQGYICAYCMRRIPTRDYNSNETSRIEHLLSRENHPDLKLDYKNMVICCPGAINSDFHCDKLKGDKDVSFDIFNESFIATLSYTSLGKIKSNNVAYDDEINKVLNLNNKLLQANRRRALSGVIRFLDKKGWTKSNINNLISGWNSISADGKNKEYCGFIVWYLKKKLNSLI